MTVATGAPPFKAAASGPGPVAWAGILRCDLLAARRPQSHPVAGHSGATGARVVVRAGSASTAVDVRRRRAGACGRARHLGVPAPAHGRDARPARVGGRARRGLAVGRRAVSARRGGAARAHPDAARGAFVDTGARESRGRRHDLAERVFQYVHGATGAAARGIHSRVAAGSPARTVLRVLLPARRAPVPRFPRARRAQRLLREDARPAGPDAQRRPLVLHRADEAHRARHSRARHRAVASRSPGRVAAGAHRGGARLGAVRRFDRGLHTGRSGGGDRFPACPDDGLLGDHPVHLRAAARRLRVHAGDHRQAPEPPPARQRPDAVRGRRGGRRPWPGARAAAARGGGGGRHGVERDPDRRPPAARQAHARRLQAAQAAADLRCHTVAANASRLATARRRSLMPSRAPRCAARCERSTPERRR